MGWLLARLYLRTAVLRKRSVIIGLFVALEVLLAFNAAGHTTFGNLLRELVTGFMLPVVALVFGSAVIRDDLEGGTLGYFLARPIPHHTLLLSRTGMAALVAMAMGLFMTLGNAVALGASGSELAAATAAIALGAFAYTCVFVALGILFRRTFLAGFMLLFADWALGRMPMGGRFASVRAHVENLAGIEPPFRAVAEMLAPPPSAVTSVLALMALSGGLMAFATWRFRRFEFSGAEG